MAITAADVWQWLPSTADRGDQPDAQAVMTRIVDAVEAHWRDRWSVLIAEAVTITEADDLVTWVNHGYTADAEVAFVLLDGATPLQDGTAYFVRDVTVDSFKVAATAAGPAIDVTVDGTAKAWVEPRPVYVDQALIMQAARLYDRRKTINGVIAGSPELGPFRVGRFDPDVEAMIDDQSWGVR